MVPSISVTPSDQIVRTNDGLTAEIAGVYTVTTCVVPAFGLVDETPERWTVRPGMAAQVTAKSFLRTIVEAGEQTEVSCAVTMRTVMRNDSMQKLLWSLSRRGSKSLAP